jgi:hypothetical protein
MRIDVTATAHAAGEMLDAAAALSDATRPHLSTLELHDRAAPPGFGAAHRRCVTEALVALDVIGEVLDGDADRLYQIALSAEEADRAVVDRMRGADRRLLTP